MVVLVQLQMLGEMADAGGEDPYLDLGRARVVLVALELFDDFLLSTAVRQICTYGKGPRQRAAEVNVVSGGTLPPNRRSIAFPHRGPEGFAALACLRARKGNAIGRAKTQTAAPAEARSPHTEGGAAGTFRWEHGA